MIHHARGPKSFADTVSSVPVHSSELCLCLSLTLGCDISGFQSPFLEQKLSQPGDSLCQRRFSQKVLQVGSDCYLHFRYSCMKTEDTLSNFVVFV